MATATRPLERMAEEYRPENTYDWSCYSRGRSLPYASDINYFPEGLSMDRLDLRNHREAKNAKISGTGYTIRGKGVLISLFLAPESEGQQPRQLIFSPRIPQRERNVNDTGIEKMYPRVFFPRDRESKFCFLISYENAGFGAVTETHTLSIARGSYPYALGIPNSVSCENGVREALSLFLERLEGRHLLPEGVYKIEIPVKRGPLLAIRLDGYKPVRSMMLDYLNLDERGPKSDGESFRKFRKLDKILRAAPVFRENPLKRYVFADQKYFEIPIFYPFDPANTWSIISSIVIEQDNPDGKDEKVIDSMDLIFDPSKMNFAGHRNNPNLGLAEIQVSRLAQINGDVRVSYTPRQVPVPNARMPVIKRFCQGCDINQQPGFLERLDMSRSVNETAFTDAVSQSFPLDTQPEWNGHVYTFRFCLR